MSSSVTPSPTPFAVPTPVRSAAGWAQRYWQDLQPTPGRLNGTLRITLAITLTLLSLLILQAPFISVPIFFVFLVGRDSPAVSLRSSFTVLAIGAAVFVELGVVIVTDNDPMARLLSVAIVGFLSGVLVQSTTLPVLGSIWGFIFATLIALWENHVSPKSNVTASLWLISATCIPIAWSIAVEYAFRLRHPADVLHEHIQQRWDALISMFTLFAENAPHEARAEAVSRVGRLAVIGQDGMQHLYNMIVERNMDTGSLHIGARVRVTMLAQMMDLASALGAAPFVNDPETLKRYALVAEQIRAAAGHIPVSELPLLDVNIDALDTLLDRVEALLHTFRSMPLNTEATDKELVALPAKKVPIFIPGALKSRATVAFGLKISLCATLCYILYHAIDYDGISTCVTTVFIAGLSTSGAIKQRFALRIVGSIIGGVIFGLGATAFLFPHMDSITSLVILVAIVTFIAAWCAHGRQFGYVGWQIAFSFFLVAFEGFSAPTALAPPRDRLIGILLALIVMWFVFDQLWPVHTVDAMRRALDTVLHNGGKLFRLPETVDKDLSVYKEADTLRDRAGKLIADLRTMNDTVEYDFGVDRELHLRLSETILRASLIAIALFWNQMVYLHRTSDRDMLENPELIEMRHKMAAAMEMMGDAIREKKTFSAPDPAEFIVPSAVANPRYREYAQTALARFRELQSYVEQICNTVWSRTQTARR